MGALKPLLPLGRATAIERVMHSVQEAGVARVIAVTGHEADRVAPVLAKMGVTQAHNPGYASGMFSSVRTGVAALPPDIDAFFVLPVDCPLVTAHTLRLLLERFQNNGKDGDKAVLYPTCLGRRGHPPLLAAEYVERVLTAAPDTNLQTLLARRAEDEVEIDVRDITVLLDMDTPADHRALSTFASALDAASESRPEPSLSQEEALFLLKAAGTPANVIRHCLTAAAVGVAMAEALRPHLPTLDIDLVRSGCLLHDLARLLPHHASLAAEVLSNLGLPRVAGVVAQHMVIDPKLPAAPDITEAELVYLADKTVADGEVVGLEERWARTMRKMRPTEQMAERIASRIEAGRRIAAKIAIETGHPFEEILEQVDLPAGARLGELRVYIVRHAQTEDREGRRYRGQKDLPLEADGQLQARALAAKLLELTNGACFDAIFSSDLLRSSRTAEIAAGECNTPVHPLPWLREIDTGLWEGLTWEEARERYPAEHAAREADLVGTPFPRGESFADLRARAVAGFERLLDDCLAAGRQRVLVVGHKGINRVILAHLRGLPPEELFTIEQDFCAVTEVTVAAGEAGGHHVLAVETR